jgi:hypothetical protein
MDQSDENSHTGYDERGNSLNYDGDTILCMMMKVSYLCL